MVILPEKYCQPLNSKSELYILIKILLGFIIFLFTELVLHNVQNEK